MLAIRLQRTGRSGHTQFRVIVQDDRFSPKSGRVTAYVGNYDPHTKTTSLDKDKITQYLTHGAQPSDRVTKLLQKEGLKMPDWVKLDGQKQRTIRNPEKLRRNRPAGAPAPAPAEETPAEEPAPETATKEDEKAPEPAAEDAEAAPVAEAPADEAKTDQPETSA